MSEGRKRCQEPLIHLGGLAPGGCRSVPAVDAEIHPALACSPREHRQRSRLSGSDQVVSGTGRRPITTRLIGMSQEMPCEPVWLNTPKTGAGAASIAGGTLQQRSLLEAWPLPRRPGWIEHVNRSQTETELAALRRCVQRGCPVGAEAWCDRMVRRLGFQPPVPPPDKNEI